MEYGFSGKDQHEDVIKNMYNNPFLPLPAPPLLIPPPLPSCYSFSILNSCLLKEPRNNDTSVPIRETQCPDFRY